MMFRQNQHLTGTDATKKHLLRSHKVRFSLLSHLHIMGLIHPPPQFLDTLNLPTKATLSPEQSSPATPFLSPSSAPKVTGNDSHMPRSPGKPSCEIAQSPQAASCARPSVIHLIPRIKPQPVAATMIVAKRRGVVGEDRGVEKDGGRFIMREGV
jgi:hypothetical protein